MTRRRVHVLVVAGVAVLAAAGLTVRTLVTPHADPPPPAGEPVVTTQVTAMTLAETATVSGELGYGQAEPVEAKAGGTVTWLPEPGAVLSRGDVLLRVDDKPVVLLYGGLPLYRPLTVGTKGADVEQFATNLRDLGFRGLAVSNTYTEALAAAVKRWQRRLGLEETGNVDLASVVYVPDRIRVAARSARIGASAAGQVLTYTPVTKVVTAEVSARNTTLTVPGTRVSVVLPTAATVEGTVSSVSTNAAPPQGGTAGEESAGGVSSSATVKVTITLADQAALGTFDRTPVDVRYTQRERKDVLTVPVSALLAPLDGGYALEVVEGARSRTVPVETGMFADGRVEVRGAGIAAGVTVRVPA